MKDLKLLQVDFGLCLASYCLGLSSEYSFHTILVTTVLFGEHDFSRLVNNKAVYSKMFRYGLS